MQDTMETPKYLSSAAICAQLGLKLSPARMEALLSVFRTTQREVTAQELRTLDTLLYDQIMPPCASPLVSFQTEDANTAAIFSNLIEKSKDISGKAPLPTPNAALRVASEVLARQGVHPPFPKGASGERLVLICNDDYPLLPLYGLRPIESQILGNTPWRIVKAVSNDPWFIFPSVNGDLCSLILPPDGEDSQERLLAFFSRKEIQKLIHRLRAVCRETYFETLLSWANGYEIDLSALPSLTELRPAEAIQKLPGGYLVCTDQTSTRLLMEEAHACGLTIAAFARVNDTSTLTFSTHGVKEFSFPTPQLRNLAQPRSLQLRTANQPSLHEQEVSVELTRIGNITLTYCSIPLLPTLMPTDVLSAFTKTMDALIKHGGDRKTAYAAVGISEHAETSPCGIWSAVLGLHRALCEQNVPSFHPVFTRADEGRLTLCLIAQTLPSYDSNICSLPHSAPAAQVPTEQTDDSQMPDLPVQTAENP